MSRKEFELAPGEILEVHQEFSNDELQTALNEAHRAFKDAPSHDARMRNAILKHYKDLAKIQRLRASMVGFK